MKIALSWAKLDCVARAGISLIMVALIAGMVGCGGGGESYGTLASNNQIEMMTIDSPPTPPVGISRTTVNVDHLTESAVILSDVPTSEWTYGCTATSAGMLFGYYDRTGYPNMYTGPTNGGVCPLTDLGQGYPSNPDYPIPGSCHIIATENGLDGINSNAHADDYWISYGSDGPDPWEGNWAEHTWGLCTADFLGTNQWKWDYSSYPGTDGTEDHNTDGSTTYWYTSDGSKLYDWYPGPAYGLPATSCCHGLRLFAESRGYTVDTNYNQVTDNQNSNGFTFAEFQSEINAGRPVLIHVTGHTMVGMGYDTTTNSIYIHDTWDNDMHSMDWGDSYAGMVLRAVTVIHLTPPDEYDLAISSTSGGSVTTPGEGVFTYYEGAMVSLVATPDDNYRFTRWTGDTGTIADVNAASTTITMNENYSVTANFEPDFMVAAGAYHTVGLKSNGTVVAVGLNDYGQCDIGGWADIVQVTAGYQNTVGLKDDSTVVAVGYNNSNQCNVSGWADILQVAAGFWHTVGLKTDGTVVAIGQNTLGECNVSGWADIVQVAAGYQHTVGLRTDGTVVAVGKNNYGQCNVSGWTDIVQVAASSQHTVGLKDDGTVVAAGRNDEGQCDVDGWADIVQVAAGYYHTVGIEADGTVVAVGLNDDGQCEVGGWVDIIQIAGGIWHTAGLKPDGTVVVVGWNSDGQCEVGGWNLLFDVLTIRSTVGGNVTEPGEDTYTYDYGTVVDLVASPGAGYCFDEWTGDVGTVADVDNATTTITMNGDYSITANFTAVYEFDLSLKSGWNMISLPLESCTGETDPSVILPHVEVIYTWNCETMSYTSPSQIVPGKGYWALVFEDVTETIYGTPVEEYQLSSDCEGWHMVGSLYSDGQINVDSGSVYDWLYHWDPEALGYVARPLDDVRPGEGYWLLAFTDFSISAVPIPPSP